jgi:hypothetical protein
MAVVYTMPGSPQERERLWPLMLRRFREWGEAGAAIDVGHAVGYQEVAGRVKREGRATARSAQISRRLVGPPRVKLRRTCGTTAREGSVTSPEISVSWAAARGTKAASDASTQKLRMANRLIVRPSAARVSSSTRRPSRYAQLPYPVDQAGPAVTAGDELFGALQAGSSKESTTVPQRVESATETPVSGVLAAAECDHAIVGPAVQ